MKIPVKIPVKISIKYRIRNDTAVILLGILQILSLICLLATVTYLYFR